MESSQRGNRSSRVTVVAVVVIAYLTLAACSSTDPSSTHGSVESSPAPTSPGTASSYTIDETTGGFIYTDVSAGYAVTFSQRPTVEPLSNNESDQPATFAAAESPSGSFASIGQVLDTAPELRSQLMGFVQSLSPTGQVGASGYTLDGLEAVRAEFTPGDSPAIPGNLVGQLSETVMAADGHNFYQLVAFGGTSDQRQAFFDSFTRIDE